MRNADVCRGEAFLVVYVLDDAPVSRKCLAQTADENDHMYMGWLI